MEIRRPLGRSDRTFLGGVLPPSYPPSAGHLSGPSDKRLAKTTSKSHTLTNLPSQSLQKTRTPRVSPKYLCLFEHTLGARPRGVEAKSTYPANTTIVELTRLRIFGAEDTYPNGILFSVLLGFNVLISKPRAPRGAAVKSNKTCAL